MSFYQSVIPNLTIDDLIDYIVIPYLPRDERYEYDDTKCISLNTEYKKYCSNVDNISGRRNELRYCNDSNLDDKSYDNFMDNLEKCSDKRHEFTNKCGNYLTNKKFNQNIKDLVILRYGGKDYYDENGKLVLNYNINGLGLIELFNKYINSNYFDSIAFDNLIKYLKSLGYKYDQNQIEATKVKIKASKTSQDFFNAIEIKKDFDYHFKNKILDLQTEMLVENFNHDHETHRISKAARECYKSRSEIQTHKAYKNIEEVEKSFGILDDNIGDFDKLDIKDIKNIKTYVDEDFFVTLSTPEDIMVFLEAYNDQKGQKSPQVFYDYYIKNKLKAENANLLGTISKQTLETIKVQEEFEKMKKKYERAIHRTDELKKYVQEREKIDEYLEMSTPEYLPRLLKMKLYKLLDSKKELLTYTDFEELLSQVNKDEFKSEIDFDVEVTNRLLLDILKGFLGKISDIDYNRFVNNIQSREYKGSVQDLLKELNDIVKNQEIVFTASIPPTPTPNPLKRKETSPIQNQIDEIYKKIIRTPSSKLLEFVNSFDSRIKLRLNRIDMIDTVTKSLNKKLRTKKPYVNTDILQESDLCKDVVCVGQDMHCDPDTGECIHVIY